ncbi:MAG TPA: GDP-mannose 4,6-dehydratase, partial [Prosthecobacter sp.]
MMNLLVTGGAGFIGSNLIRQIIDKPEVTKLVNLDCLTYAGCLENLDGIHDVHPRYHFEKVDLRDKAEVLRVVRAHDITHVMHLAAESHVDRSISGPGDFITTNINGTFHLLEACREVWETTANSEQRTANRFLHVSTDEVYGSLGPGDPPFTESSPYAPNSPYSASKAASDMLVRSYHHTYGLPTLITNCSNNYGPRQHPEKLIPVVLHSLLTRQPIPVYGDGLNIRDWIHVDDHCAA